MINTDRKAAPPAKHSRRSSTTHLRLSQTESWCQRGKQRGTRRLRQNRNRRTICQAAAFFLVKNWLGKILVCNGSLRELGVKAWAISLRSFHPSLGRIYSSLQFLPSLEKIRTEDLCLGFRSLTPRLRYSQLPAVSKERSSVLRCFRNNLKG